MADSRNALRGPPSGSWNGYYLYAPSGPQNRQSMRLSFNDGKMSGVGSDGIGRFTVEGHYDTESSTVRWNKKYVGLHSVEYRGYFERGVIWGVWRIDEQCRGGFKIWPAALETCDNCTAEAAIPSSIDDASRRYPPAGMAPPLGTGTIFGLEGVPWGTPSARSLSQVCRKSSRRPSVGIASYSREHNVTRLAFLRTLPRPCFLLKMLVGQPTDAFTIERSAEPNPKHSPR